MSDMPIKPDDPMFIPLIPDMESAVEEAPMDIVEDAVAIPDILDISIDVGVEVVEVVMLILLMSIAAEYRWIDSFKTVLLTGKDDSANYWTGSGVGTSKMKKTVEEILRGNVLKLCCGRRLHYITIQTILLIPRDHAHAYTAHYLMCGR